MIPQAVGVGGETGPAEAVAEEVASADPESGTDAEGAFGTGFDGTVGGGEMKRSRSSSQFTVPSFVFWGTIASRIFLGKTSH